jgi:hypothetical protein
VNAYLVEDAAGSWWQYIDPEVSEYITVDGEQMHLGRSQLGGWYDLRCAPVNPEAVTHPVVVKWTRDV